MRFNIACGTKEFLSQFGLGNPDLISAPNSYHSQRFAQAALIAVSRDSWEEVLVLACFLNERITFMHCTRETGTSKYFVI